VFFGGGEPRIFSDLLLCDMVIIEMFFIVLLMLVG